MKLNREALRLYAVTDRSWLQGETLYEQVEKAIRGGVTFVQLREKRLGREEIVTEARQIRELCRRFHVPFVINDDVDIALEVDADGVHVGQGDMAAGDARKMLGRDKIVGVTARTVEQAVTAQEQGADYLGVGAVFPTSTKEDAREMPYELLCEICKSVTIPVVAIGGISAENVVQLRGSGIAGAAVVSAIFAKKDTEGAARELREQLALVAE